MRISNDSNALDKILSHIVPLLTAIKIQDGGSVNHLILKLVIEIEDPSLLESPHSTL